MGDLPLGQGWWNKQDTKAWVKHHVSHDSLVKLLGGGTSSAFFIRIDLEIHFKTNIDDVKETKDVSMASCHLLLSFNNDDMMPSKRQVSFILLISAFLLFFVENVD